MKHIRQTIRLAGLREVFDQLQPRRIYAIFNVSRGRPSAGAAGDSKPPGLEFAAMDADFSARFPNVLVLDVRSKALDTTTEMADLAITAAEEWVDLIRCVYEFDSGPPVVVDVHKEPGGAREARAVRSGLTVDELLVNAEREYVELWKQLPALKGMPPPRYRKFFADLDRHTEPALRKAFEARGAPQGLPPAHDVDETRQALLVHLQARLATPRGRGLPPPDDDVYANTHENARSIAQLYLRLVRKYFASEGAIDFGAYDQAFEMFANGELRLRLNKYGSYTTQPSSGFFFLFGELALFCAACGAARAANWRNPWWRQEARTWRRLAGPMIWSQRIFCAVYARKGPTSSADFTDYAEAHFRGSLSPEEKRRLIAPLKDASFDELVAASADQVQRRAPDLIGV